MVVANKTKENANVAATTTKERFDISKRLIEELLLDTKRMLYFLELFLLII